MPLPLVAERGGVHDDPVDLHGVVEDDSLQDDRVRHGHALLVPRGGADDPRAGLGAEVEEALVGGLGVDEHEAVVDVELDLLHERGVGGAHLGVDLRAAEAEIVVSRVRDPDGEPLACPDLRRLRDGARVASGYGDFGCRRPGRGGGGRSGLLAPGTADPSRQKQGEDQGARVRRTRAAISGARHGVPPAAGPAGAWSRSFRIACTRTTSGPGAARSMNKPYAARASAFFPRRRQALPRYR